MDKKFYVYAHFQESDGRIFYIGKGNGDRAYRTRGRNAFWRHIVKKHGLTVKIIASGLLEEDSFRIEMSAIALCKNMGARLANLTDGGEGNSGWNPSPESRRRMSESNVFRRPEFIEKMKKDRTGKKLSEEHKRKIGLAGIGRIRLESSNEKARQKMLGRKMTEEQRKKMSESQKRRPPITEQTRLNMSKAGKGKIISEYCKQKTSEANSKKVLCSNGLTFSSATNAAKWIVDSGLRKSAYQGNISSCCYGKLKTAYGFSWSFAKESEE